MATSLYSSQRAVLARPLDATDTTHAAVPLIQKLFIGFALLVMSGAVIPLLRESSKASYDPNVGDQSSAWIYVGVYLLVVPLTLTRLAQMIQIVTRVKWLMAFTMLVPLSTLWSTSPQLTLQRSVPVLLLTMFAIYVAARFSPREILVLLGWVFAIALAGSIAFAVFVPELGTMGGGLDGAWRGIYYHKNFLGRFLDIGLIVFTLLALDAHKWRVLLWGMVGLTTIVILLSQSATAIITGLMLVLMIPIFRVVQRTRSPYPTILVFLVLALGTVLVYRFADLSTALGVLGKEQNLTGRTELWPVLIDFAATRPWLGFGYSGFWLGWTGPSGIVWSIFVWEPTHAHNGYIDLVLDLGLLGLAVFTVTIVMAFRSAIAFARQGTEWTLLAPLLFPPILLTVNIPQSVILQRNDVFWILTVVMICSAALHAPSTAPIARPVEPVDAHLPVSVRP